jgi:hypothetical protein
MSKEDYAANRDDIFVALSKGQIKLRSEKQPLVLIFKRFI